MNTDEINFFLKRNKITKRKFRGVFAYDENPKPKKEGYYVFNLDKSHEPGSHWIAIKISKGNKKNFFFDSYGMAPQKYKFKKFMNNFYNYNSKTLQYPLSTTCGQWCIFFIYYSCQGIPPKRIFSTFTQNLMNNDYEMNCIISNVIEFTGKIFDFQMLAKQVAEVMDSVVKHNSYYAHAKSNRLQ